MLPDYFEFSLPTKLVFGIGILENLGETVKPFGKRKAILVTDEILVKTGLVEKVKSGFKATPIKIAATFDQVPPNSTIDAVEKCAALATKKGCDMFIAVGGGSVIDTAKVANLLAVKGGSLQDHMGAYLLGSDEILLPAIVIPTTAGTGSEVTKVAVIADPENDVKLPFAEAQFLPHLAILDPTMTVSMPGKLTAMTGMDALTHAIEAYVDQEWSPASDALALHAITLISGNILQACAKPDDLQARGAMQVGSFLAGVAFSHSMVGMVHGIAHALGGVYHIPHGLANALILPEVMAYNLEARIDRYADIALAMGISFPQVVGQSRSLLRSSRLDVFSKLANLSAVDSLKQLVTTSSHQARHKVATVIGNFGFIDAWVRGQAAQAAVEKIRCLNQQLAYLTKMPLNLKDAGISDKLARIEQVATIAMEDGAMLYNPVEPERDAVIEIVKRAYHVKPTPLPVSKADLRPLAAARSDKAMTHVFKDAKMLYAVLAEFYELLKDNPEIGPKLAQSNLCVQFRYKHPSAVITIDATGAELKIIQGDFDGQPEVVLTMNADFAHAFWHGKANLVSALTRRQVKAKGNVPKTIKLLPILKPGYALYPKFLADKGLRHLVMT
ncbi:MAG: iron-containing alcohol dehydrogenase [Desulfosarcina sp.]|nr:iron-containing alcohol dehydrogenase [Desulfosarcina sp.]